MTLLNIAIHFAIGLAISLLGFYFFRKFIKKYFTKKLNYFFLSYGALCLLIFLFLIASGGFTWYINTSIWYEFASFLGAFLLAATLLFQIRSSRRQQIEAKFFELIKYNRENVSEMKMRNPFHHKKDSHAEGRRVFKLIFDQYKVARGIVDFEKVVDKDNIANCLKNPEQYGTFFFIQSACELDSDKKKIFIENEIAYLITYWGVSNGTVQEIEDALSKDFNLPYKEFKLEDNENLVKAYPELKTKLISQILKCIAFYKCDGKKNDVKDCDKNCNSEFTNSIYAHKKQSKGRAFKGCHEFEKKTKFFRGHHYQLGHYFRHLLQTIKFIDQQPTWLFSQNEKYEYAKMLRAQLSDYEQALLFINSLTRLGRNWEYSNKEERRLITDYQMIKNLSQHFIPNMDPQDYYPKVDFEWKENRSKKKKASSN